MSYNTLLPILIPTSRPFMPVAFKISYAKDVTYLDYRYEHYLHIKEQYFSDIKYCPECLREQMKTFGFTWFCREWQLYHANECIKHGRPLNKFIVGNVV